MPLQNDSLERLFSYEITTLDRHHSYIVITVIYVLTLILLENDGNVYFGNFTRDVISIIVTSYGIRIVNNITNNKQRLEIVSPEHPEKSNQTKFIEEFKEHNQI